MNTKKLMMTCGLAACLLVQPAVAGPFDDGLNAYESGDYATALQLWLPLAVQGDAAAQYNLGQLYINGNGVLQDDADALKWFLLAAKQGLVSAQFNVGDMYFNGHGVPKDDVEAVKWYHLAADQGHAKAQYNLGILYGRDQGIPQDLVQTHLWLSLAAIVFAASDIKLHDSAANTLEFIATQMTPKQIAEAQRLAREWMATHAEK